MPTRSLVGTVNEAGLFRGRYIHHDAAPTSMATELSAMIARDGLPVALRVITEDHYGWSSLAASQPDIEGVTPDRDARRGTPAEVAYTMTSGVYSDGRFASIPGYGLAYTTKEGQSNPDDWHCGSINYDSGVFTLLNDSWCSWGYVFENVNASTPTLHILDFTREVLAASIPVSDLAATDFSKIECGENYERCVHMAFVHVEDLPEDAKDLSMMEWLGRNRLAPRKANSVTVGDQEYVLGDGGCQGFQLDRMRRIGAIFSVVGEDQSIHPGWYATITPRDGDEVSTYIRVEDEDGQEVPGVGYSYPPSQPTE